MEKITLEELTERITSGEKIIDNVILVGKKTWKEENGLIETFSYLKNNDNGHLHIENSDLSGLEIDWGYSNDFLTYVGYIYPKLFLREVIFVMLNLMGLSFMMLGLIGLSLMTLVLMGLSWRMVILMGLS